MILFRLLKVGLPWAFFAILTFFVVLAATLFTYKVARWDECSNVCYQFGYSGGTKPTEDTCACYNTSFHPRREK